MINSVIELILKWSEDCVLTEKATRERKKATQNPRQDAVPAFYWKTRTECHYIFY